MAGQKKLSIDSEDITDIKNLFTNTMMGHIQDRSQLKELIDDEENLLNKLDVIPKQRDDLLDENKKLKAQVRKLEKDVGKINKG